MVKKPAKKPVKKTAKKTPAKKSSAKPGTDEMFALSSSRGFPEWLASTGGSIAFTTYQAGKLFLLGVKEDGKLSVFERTFPRCMGLAVSENGRQLYMSSLYQLYRFDNTIPAGQTYQHYDGLFVPRVSWVTGDLDIHDIIIGQDGKPIFVNTLFGCLASVSEGYSFKPLWKPPFLSKLAAEDRCHLNGLAGEDGVPRFVTAVSTSDVNDGWRDRRSDGGVVIDVASNEIVTQGLSMPHSPRLHNGQLWVINSGAGQFGRINLNTGEFEEIAFCPGYGRGLTFAGNKAVIGLSGVRENRTFQGLPLDEALKKRDAEARCGLHIVDLDTGDANHWVRIEGVVNELYDVAFLPGIKCPSAVGFKGNEIQTIIAIDER